MRQFPHLPTNRARAGAIGDGPSRQARSEQLQCIEVGFLNMQCVEVVFLNMPFHVVEKNTAISSPKEVLRSGFSICYYRDVSDISAHNYLCPLGCSPRGG
jgi:hypothetical protein